RIVWRANVAFATELGIEAIPEAIRVIDPKLLKGSDGLWRPSAGSPLLGAAQGDFSFVPVDLDDQPPGSAKDVGAAHRSPHPPRRLLPATGDVGPAWMRER